MSNLTKKLNQSIGRKRRVRARIHGTATCPRLSINISNKHILAQLINDEDSQTIGAVSTVSNAKLTGTMTEKAIWVGDEIAKKAKTLKVKKVIFDRGDKLYHGRIKALADAARAGGLEF